MPTDRTGDPIIIERRKVKELKLDDITQPATDHERCREMIALAPDGMLAELIVDAATELQGRLDNEAKEPATLADTEPPNADRLPAVWPWLEVNNPRGYLSDIEQHAEGRADMTMREWAIEGMHHWAEVTDTVIVTTRPDQRRRLYPFLMNHKPPWLSIVGGLKTYQLPGAKPNDPRPYDFANPEAWGKLFDAAKYVRDVTGRPEVVFENETTFEKYTKGAAPIDPQRVSDTLAPLSVSGRAGRTIWNLPTVLGNTEEFPDRAWQTLELIRAIVRALPDCVFLSRDTAWHGWREVSSSLRHHGMLEHVVGRDRVHDRLLVTPDGLMHYDNRAPRRCYTPVEAVAEVRQVRGPVVNLYTGWRHWVAVAREFAAEMKATRPKPKRAER